MPIDFFSGKEAILVAGFAGGLTRVVISGAKHMMEVIQQVVVGTIASFYFTVPVCNYFNFTAPEEVGAVGFAMGVIGISIVELLVKLGERGKLMKLVNAYIGIKVGTKSDDDGHRK